MIRLILRMIAFFLPERVIRREGGEVYLRRYYLWGEPGDVLEKYFPEGTRMRWWQHFLTWLPLTYLHKFEESDSDEELHDHPWSGTSLILAGGYLEERRKLDVERSVALPSGDGHVFESRYYVDRRAYRPGQVNRLGPATFHRVLLFEKDCWSVIKVGDRKKSWGFFDMKTGRYEDWRTHLKRRGIQLPGKEKA